MAAAVAAACTESALPSFGTKAEGESCRTISDCQPGFECDGVCKKLAPPGTDGRAGSTCTNGEDCSEGLCCGSQGVCRARLEAFEDGRCGLAAGAVCGLASDCDVGLICNGFGECVGEMSGGEGQASLGGACKEISDCRRPLLCGPGNTCVQPPFIPPVSCIRSDDEIGGFRMYFEVPRRTTRVDEFYRLPFPNDVRVENGRVSLSGHASPGELGGLDFTGLYFDAIEEDSDGFGLSQPVFLRFSDRVDQKTLSSTAAEPTVYMVDIDPESPEIGTRVPTQLTYNREKGLFMCQNALGVAPHDGRPLRPRTTYAVIVTSGVRSFRGEKPIHDLDFSHMVGTTRPPMDDVELARAWDLYAPLRAHLASAGIAKDDVAGAAVFTTGDPAAIAEALYRGVSSAPAPTASGVVRCGAGVVSPCSEPGGERDCTPARPSYIEIHGKVTNPIMQNGTRPYRLAGGEIELANGVARVQGSEELCFSLAIPAGAMPAGGWPIAIYGHGTGGNFTSAMGDVASELAQNGIATLGFDNVMHGPRQGLAPGEREDPGRLFFNAANPRASRDNVLQGGADLFNLVRFAGALELSTAQTGLGAPVRFDGENMLLYGHSQGTVIAPVFLAQEPKIRAAVLSGAGAEIGLTLIHKRRPNDIAGLVRAAFGDHSVTRIHPMIALLSWYFGPADALPYAGRWMQNADVLHIYGLEDGYTPEVTQQALVRAGGYPLVGTVLRPIDGVPSAGNPASGSGVVEFAPPMQGGEPAFDGHFVGTRDPQARATIVRFLRSAANGAAPAVIQR